MPRVFKVDKARAGARQRMGFEDHFSQQAERYARYRPRYPQELYRALANLAPARELAWDCGTGNGQAAVELARHFEQVVATDASQQQIEHAFPHPKVEYRVERAESTSFADGVVDLVTVGTAVHWFEFESFYAEVRRVGKPGSLIAVWSYHLPQVSDEIDEILGQYYAETLAGYWPDRLRYLDERYRTLPFPFQELDPPNLSMRSQWELDKLVGFVLSWSGTKNLIEDQGRRAMEPIVDRLVEIWGDAEQARDIRWPLHFRIGRIHGEAESGSQGRD